MKFEIGDRVRYARNGEDEAGWISSTGTVISLNNLPPSAATVEWDSGGQSRPWFDRLELVDPLELIAEVKLP